ncbi:MAG: hypothetical protein ACXIT9_04745 [Nitritalea sp.]
MPAKKDEIFTPEMVKILKIFGLGSLLFVFLLSFFNERRADNSGDSAPEMRVGTADRMYFHNMRASNYEREGRKDAKMSIFRHRKRTQEAAYPLLNFSILINWVKDEAYIYVEPNFEELPIHLRWQDEEGVQSGEVLFQGGDKFAHYYFARELFPLLEESRQFELLMEGEWVPVLENEKEQDILKTTLQDYFRMTNLKLPAS